MKATRIIVLYTISVVFIMLGATRASADGTSWHTPVPDTGQTRSCTNTYGEDSDYSTNPRSYTKLDANGNDLPATATSWVMVRDNVTGLIWEVKTDDGGIHDKDNRYTWYDSNPATNGGDAGTPGNGTDTEDFINALNSSGFGGYTDWRLPTKEELITIIDHGNSNPPINVSYFPNSKEHAYYWSSTTCAGQSAYAWSVYFHWSSSITATEKHKWLYDYYSWHCVRAVRGGQSTSGTLVDNGDGTITDTTTGLMWQQGEGGPMEWENALTYSENLNLAGYSDWRLPNVNELHSLADSSKYNPAIDTTKFPDASGYSYWSSTALSHYPNLKWTVDFGDGYHTYGPYVRAVRGGQVQVFGHLDILNISPAPTIVRRGDEISISVQVKNRSVPVYGYVALSAGSPTGETIGIGRQGYQFAAYETKTFNFQFPIPPDVVLGPYDLTANVCPSLFSCSTTLASPLTVEDAGAITVDLPFLMLLLDD